MVETSFAPILQCALGLSTPAFLPSDPQAAPMATDLSLEPETFKTFLY
jgi:hypothetical protein